GISRRSWEGVAIATAGGLLILRAVTGHSRLYELLGIKTAGIRGDTGVKVVKTMTIDKSPEELYNFWRNFENLPRIMSHLKSVKKIDDRRSHWIVNAPAGMTVEWDAEIVNEKKNELIEWRSAEEADIF